MAKTKSLHWQPPPTRQCDQCQGLGIVRGLFSSGPCAQCDGAGLVDEDGEQIPHDDAVAIMRQRLEMARFRYRQLLNTPGVREAVKAERENRHQQHLGYGKGKYQGD